MSPAQPYILATPVGPDGVVKCYGHGLPAELQISHSIANPNRKYYRCAVHKDNKCRFFEWADNLVFKQTVPPSSANSPPRVPRANPQQLQSSQASSSTMDSEYAGMTPSEKRVAIMAKALACPPDIDMRPPSPVTLTPMRYPPTPTPTQPRRSIDRDEDDFEDFDGINDDVFASLPATPSQSTAVATPRSPIDRIAFSSPLNRLSDFRVNSPKRPRLNDPHDDELDDARSTTFSLARSQTPSSHSSGQYATPMSSPSRTVFPNDPPDPFSQASIFSRDQSLPSNPTSPDTHTSSPAKSDVEPSSQSFWAFLGGWRVVEAYAKKLERKILALEKGNQFKTKKIAEQSKEIESLRARLRALEEENNTLKARWH